MRTHRTASELRGVIVGGAFIVLALARCGGPPFTGDVPDAGVASVDARGSAPGDAEARDDGVPDRRDAGDHLDAEAGDAARNDGSARRDGGDAGRDADDGGRDGGDDGAGSLDAGDRKDASGGEDAASEDASARDADSTDASHADSGSGDGGKCVLCGSDTTCCPVACCTSLTLGSYCPATSSGVGVCLGRAQN